MKLFKSGPKPGQVVETPPPVDPASMEQPTDAAAYLRRGYAYLGIGQYPQAAEDFRKALELDPASVDSVYALGMSLKADGKKEEATTAFLKAIALLDEGAVKDKSRARILRRLALGHVNEIATGNWNLEAEIWQHVA